MAYDATHLRLNDWQVGLPLAALGIGVGVGCLLAGKLSAPRVEYGLLPFGALGLTLTTLAFALIGPAACRHDRRAGVPGHLQRVPVRAAQCPLAVAIAARTGGVRSSRWRTRWSTPACCCGSVLALVLARTGIDAARHVLGRFDRSGCGFLWALSLVPAGVPAVPDGRAGAHALSRASRGPRRTCRAKGGRSWCPTT